MQQVSLNEGAIASTSPFQTAVNNKWKVISAIAMTVMATIAILSSLSLLAPPLSAVILGLTVLGLLGVAILLNKGNEQTTLTAPKVSISTLAAEELKTKTPEALDKDWNLGTYFGHIKIIGNKASPRYSQLKDEMKKIGLTEEKFELVPGVRGADLSESLWKRVPDWNEDMKTVRNKQGVSGCTVAHYNLIKDTNTKYKNAVTNLKQLQSENAGIEKQNEAQKEIEKYSSVLVMEDNNAFGLLQKDGSPVLKGLGTTFRKTMQELPENWDMFYFICMHGQWGKAETVPNAPHLLKATYGCVSKCFAINHTAYDQLEKKYHDAIHGNGEFLPVDHLLGSLHKETNTYIAKIPLAYRFASQSMVSTENKGNPPWQPIPE